MLDLLLLTCIGAITICGRYDNKGVTDYDEIQAASEAGHQFTDDQEADDQEADDQVTDDQHTDDQHTDDQVTDDQVTDHQVTDDQEADDAVSMQLASSFVRLLESAERHKAEQKAAERHKAQLPISEIQAEDLEFNDFREGWAASWGIGPLPSALPSAISSTQQEYPQGTWLRFFNDNGNQGVVVSNGMFIVNRINSSPACNLIKLADWLILAKTVGNGAISIPPEGASPPPFISNFTGWDTDIQWSLQGYDETYGPSSGSNVSCCPTSSGGSNCCRSTCPPSMGYPSTGPPSIIPDTDTPLSPYYLSLLRTPTSTDLTRDVSS